MTDKKRLIEVDFPLEQTSLDSVHEKNVRHGHISTLHIWPARRPLAASRAALIATLLPDPGDAETRKAIYKRLAGEVVETIERKKVGGKTVEKRKRETLGGILHWGRESGPDLDWFRQEIRKAYGGRAPRVLDPFSGGGAIPLEAMRLGCDVTAMDINPVAWFLLKCTLEYPQKLAGQTRPLPDFALKDRAFMEAFLKAKGFKGAGMRTQLERLGLAEDREPTFAALSDQDPVVQADLAWQVRAWGSWVLGEARRKLAQGYPTYAEFQSLKPGGKAFEQQALRLLEPDANGLTDVEPLNAGCDTAWLKDPRNPRWVVKPTVAYLWARTVRCKGCRATIPLLKTRWLAKKEKKRVLLTMEPNAEHTGMVFGVQNEVPVIGGNAAQRREADKRFGAGTMSRSGAQCPCCPTIMTSEDIRLEGRAGRLAAVMTAVVIDGPEGKEYRSPTTYETDAGNCTDEMIVKLFENIPFGLPREPIPVGGSRTGGGSPFTTPSFGIDEWAKLFTNRQLICLGTFTSLVRSLHQGLREVPSLWSEAITACLALVVDRIADRGSTIAHWDVGYEKVANTFSGFRLPISWDFSETAVLSDTTGSYSGQLEWVARYIEHGCTAGNQHSGVRALRQSATTKFDTSFDVIITDPPYYDAIPYSDLMDFFHVWLRRSTHGLSAEIDDAFSDPLGPKWDHRANDGELIDDASRFGGDKARSKKNYEDGMARAFLACHSALTPEGRLVVVFANKQPDAWETLVSALIRAGFVVDGSWPIQTEMGNRTRSLSSAALASSVWLVCKKRPATARPGWDNTVLGEMRDNIHTQVRTFWDAGIRGPDFVWAATGPAMEAFSKHPVVKKADEPGAVMTVTEVLRQVRRLVVDFVVGRVLTHGTGDTASGLDDVTTYYLLHRNDFGLDDAPVGACILYALSCNLSDGELADRLDILSRTGGTLFDEDERDDSDTGAGGDDADEAPETGGKGNKVRLKAWNQRKGKSLGYEAVGGRPVPLIDQAHRLMILWRAGEEAKVDDYLETRGLKRNALFAQLLQALIELAPAASEERSILESLSNHLAARGGITAPRQKDLL